MPPYVVRDVRQDVTRLVGRLDCLAPIFGVLTSRLRRTASQRVRAVPTPDEVAVPPATAMALRVTPIGVRVPVPMRVRVGNVAGVLGPRNGFRAPRSVEALASDALRAARTTLVAW